MFKSISLFITLGLLVSNAQAQTWRSDLYPTDWQAPEPTVDFYTDAFLQDFSYAGYHRGEAEPATPEGPVIDVTAAPYFADSTGTEDATTAIQAAIDTVASLGGGTVYLPPGTYRISPTEDTNEALRISHSNILLKGAGKDLTYLYNSSTAMRRKRILRVMPEDGVNWDSGPGDTPTALITRDLTGPSISIPVDRPALFAVGDDVIVRSPMTNAWVSDHNEGPDWFDQAARLDGIIHFRTVVEVTDSSIVIDAPTRYVHLVRDGSYVYRSNAGMLSEVGLEDFSIGNRESVATDPNAWLSDIDRLDNNLHNQEGSPAYESSGSYAIEMNRVQNGWIRGVSSYRHPENTFGSHLLSNGVLLAMSSKVTLDGVYMGYLQYGGGGGNAYGFRIESNDCLLMNCTAEVTRHGFSYVRMWSSGNVMHLDTCLRSGKATANTSGLVRTGSSGSDFHQWFSPSNLIDRMHVDESYFSAVHRRGVGSVPNHNAVTAHSVFWNFTANNSPQGYAIRTSQTRYGYVIGTSGATPGVTNRPDDPRNLQNPDVTGASFAFRYDVGGARTMPFDIVEGEGIGDRLEPASLYLDQLDRRLNPTSISGPAPAFRPLNIYPNPSATGIFRLNEAAEWRVYTASGRQVTSGSGNRVVLTNFPRGLYFLRTPGHTARLIY